MNESEYLAKIGRLLQETEDRLVVRVEAMLAAERARAAAEERESCARLAETPMQVGAEAFRPKTPEEIAILIRARQ